jgi:hypothetical protein
MVQGKGIRNGKGTRMGVDEGNRWRMEEKGMREKGGRIEG